MLMSHSIENITDARDFSVNLCRRVGERREAGVLPTESLRLDTLRVIINVKIGR
jgi:hypothetical protein